MQAFGVSSMLSCWFLSHSQVSDSHIRVLLLLLVLLLIWRGRNSTRFHVSSFNSAQVIFQLEGLVSLMGIANLFSSAHFVGDVDYPGASLVHARPRRTQLQLVSWSKPSHDWFKLNSDTSILNGLVAGGWFCKIIREKLYLLIIRGLVSWRFY